MKERIQQSSQPADLTRDARVWTDDRKNNSTDEDCNVPVERRSRLHAIQDGHLRTVTKEGSNRPVEGRERIHNPLLLLVREFWIDRERNDFVTGFFRNRQIPCLVTEVRKRVLQVQGQWVVDFGWDTGCAGDTLSNGHETGRGS